MDEIDSQVFQNSIRYLHNVSTLPETNIPALKSFICLKRRLMELRKNAFLPSSATKPHLHCQRCFLNFFDGPASYKMKSKLKKQHFAKKLLNKQKNGHPLTRYQEKYLKRNNKFNGSYLVTICKFCKFESKVKMHQPPEKEVKLSTKISVKKKKKKNKKDKFCGLDQSIVMSVTSNKSNNNNNMNDSDVIFVGSEEPQTPAEIKKIKQFKHKHDSDIICLDTDDSKTLQKLKMKKKQSLVTSTPKPIINSLLSKKKKKAQGKLAEFLKKSSKKNKSSSNLLQFLQNL